MGRKPKQTAQQKRLAAIAKNNARVRSANAAKKVAATKQALANKNARAAAAKKRATQVAKFSKLTPQQRREAIDTEQYFTGRRTGKVGPKMPKKSRVSPGYASYIKKEKKLIQTSTGKITPAESRRRAAAKKMAKKTPAKSVVKPTVKPTAKPAAKKTVAKAPAYKAPATAQSKAYSKDARNKEYDRLRKAGKTKEAEALGKKIAAEMSKKAPKNPFRAPQGAERKDNSYKAVAALKGMRNFNKGLAINPDKGPTFKVKPTPKPVLSADERNRKRRNNNIA